MTYELAKELEDAGFPQQEPGEYIYALKKNEKAS